MLRHRAIQWRAEPAQLAADFAGRARMVKVEMGKNQQAAMAWRVRAAPTLLLFKNGAVQATHVGMASKRSWRS
jgi:thioredoxin 1